MAAVGGLDDYDLTPAYGKNSAAAAPDFTSATGAHFLSPGDIATIYDLNPLGLDGTGQKIAVIGNPIVNLTDIRELSNGVSTFRQRSPDDAGGTRSDEHRESFGGGYRPGMVRRRGAPTRRSIYVYSRSVNTAAQYAVDQRVAPVITMSYGACEQATTPAMRSVAQQANAEGITWVASTGDVGAAGCERQEILPQASKGLAVQFPASIPEITAVGGTEFNDAEEPIGAPRTTPTAAPRSAMFRKSAGTIRFSTVTWRVRPAERASSFQNRCGRRAPACRTTARAMFRISL